MTSVFIGGSRAVARLNQTVLAKLDDLIRRKRMIFIGDANGADKAVQRHFATRGYEHVLVYCMHERRNNLGGWPTKHMTSASPPNSFSYYAVKDLAMARDAKCGVMLWDGRSKGTLNNIRRLVAAGKKKLVYFAPEGTFHKITDENDLDVLLECCEPSAVDRAQQQLAAKLQPQPPLEAPPV